MSNKLIKEMDEETWRRFIAFCKLKNVKVNVEYLTRVEGHGNIVVNVKEGVLEECRLDIVESPRFFEGMLRGRSIFEAQHITSRICGICSCGHTLASIQAAEDAIGFMTARKWHFNDSTSSIGTVDISYETEPAMLIFLRLLRVRRFKMKRSGS